MPDDLSNKTIKLNDEIESRCIYDLSIGSVFQNEARFLREWIEFHKLMGVQHFVLVNDRSTDNFWEVLQPYVRSGEVELFSNPCPELLRGRDWPQYQLAVHAAIVKYTRSISRWLALIDIDEFVVPSNVDSVLRFLHDYEDFGALYVRWEPFGTSYVARVPDRALMTTTLHLKGHFIRGCQMYGKSIVKPHRVLHANIHRCDLLPGFPYWDSNPEMQSETSLIRLFHYCTRDEDFLLHYKLPRTYAIKDWNIKDHSPSYFMTLFNDVPDYSMRRFETQLRARVFVDCATKAE